MASKKGLFNLERNVQEILETDEQSRGSDRRLYVELLRDINPKVLEVPLRSFMDNFEVFDIPPIESVGRVRRKVQERCPWLLPADKVRKFRTDNEEAFRQYVKDCEVR